MKIVFRIEVQRDEANRIIGFTASGHTNYSAKGQDIVCAAISALTQTAILGLDKVAGINPTVEVDSGYLRCSLPSVLEPVKKMAAGVVLDTMIVGIEQIATQYSQHVRIINHNNPNNMVANNNMFQEEPITEKVKLTRIVDI